MLRDRALQHHLRHGGVIAYATESCFGLGCDPRNRVAVQRLLRLKGRPQAKGLILIASHLAQLQHYL
ncbi:MAG: Sua5/YciO/YrdC/YwlC family protein, partial [Betaproteobacteria bacterium]|nr:Sua5/YciO/YrdC/YwlC family protein [Betaproteobacteria bacterium]